MLSNQKVGTPQFQSSSSPKAGCNEPGHCEIAAALDVSILIQPEGRMQPVCRTHTIRVSTRFQSSSSPKAGCNYCTVSHFASLFRVSILIQPEGRMQQFKRRSIREGVYLFQSSSSPKAGCNWTMMRYLQGDDLFQSSSSPKAGCNRLSCNACGRLADVFQSSSSPKAGCNSPPWYFIFTTTPRFQSSSSPKAGCNGIRDSRSLEICSFQSSSSPKAGCNPTRRWPWPTTGSFNPHPARRPDATRRVLAALHGRLLVSILIQPEGRMQHLAGVRVILVVEVSILIQPEGRMQRPSSCPWPSAAPTCFNPHPARRPDATTQGLGEVAIRFGVSILIQPEGRMQLSDQVDALIDQDLFQSSSSPKAGCNSVGRSHRAGGPPCFNPHPARRPDATPGYVFSTQSSRTSPVASEIGQMACNCSVCFPHVLSMNANLLLTGAIAIGSRHASSGSVKSITLPCPYSSTR